MDQSQRSPSSPNQEQPNAPDGESEGTAENGQVDSSAGPKGADDHAETDADSSEAQGPSPRTKKILLISAIAAVMLLLLIGIPWWLHARHFESTDDAFIDAHWEKVAPQVSGRVLKVLVNDNDVVEAGQTLAEVDPSSFTVEVERASAALAEANGKVQQAQAQKLVALASVEQAKADVERNQVNRDNAVTELKRYEGLSPEAVSKQRLDDLRAAARTAEAQLTAAEKSQVAASAQVEFAASQIVSNQAGVQSAQSQVDQAKLYLSWTHVKALTAGRVTRRGVQAGDYVTSASQLMLIVPQNVWVTANFKETQLTFMRPGEPVEIQVDAFPDVDFHGKVQSIQSGSGPWFSLLPPENATGNYVKVVQRVPVKIEFDDPGSDAYKMLSPGMSVVPKVRVK